MPSRHCKSAVITSYAAESIYDFRNGIYDKVDYQYMIGQIVLCPLKLQEQLFCFVEVMYPCSSEGFRSILCDPDAVVRFNAFNSREQLIHMVTCSQGRLDGPYSYD